MTPRERGKCERWLRSQFIAAIKHAHMPDPPNRTRDELNRFLLGWLEGAAGWSDGELDRLVEAHLPALADERLDERCAHCAALPEQGCSEDCPSPRAASR